MTQRYFRNGRDHRQGASIGFAELRRRFGFRSIRIGRWITPAERDASCLRFYDALCDLMDILAVPESVISLRGSLSLEYGIGGRPGVSAHYTPASRAFALAKNAGPGSIAHEWFHAFDHYIVTKAMAEAPGGWFASRAWLHSKPLIQHPLNDRLFRCFQVVLLDASGEQPSELFRRSAEIDRQRGSLYYSQPEELCARAFEAFVEDSPIVNRFLVRGSRDSTEAQQGVYPQGEERVLINHAFAEYFSALGTALKRK